jgi:peptidoglycan/LPS O-acetylase OafA/YrhL
VKAHSNLDLLRAGAVVLVLLSHLPDFLDGVSWAFNYKTVGRVGVALFFVHTTLVLMMSLERQGAALAPFLVRRIFRIYPLAIAVVLCMAAMLWMGQRPIGLGEIFSNLLLVQNLTGHRSWPDPLWTLPYEVQMYLLLPALFSFTCGSVRRMAGVYATALAVAVLMWSASVRNLSIGFVPCFLPGAVAFVLSRRVQARLPPWVLFGLVGLGAVAVPALVTAGFDEMVLFWVLCLLVGVTIPLCREITSRPTRFVAKQLATYSYGIYLTHVFAMGLTLMGTDMWWGFRLSIFLFAQAVLAWVAYRLIEAPGIRAGVRLATWLQAAGHGGRLKQNGFP